MQTNHGIVAQFLIYYVPILSCYSQPSTQIGIYGNVTAHRDVAVQQIVNQAPASTVFDLLAPYFVPDALYNSPKRRSEYAVICHEETQINVLRAIRSWANAAPDAATRICWLSGRAGTGKTTVAHTIAEEYDRKGRLAATFFLWRSTGDRDEIHNVVPTIAFQIADKFPLAKEGMERALLKESSLTERQVHLPSGLKYQLSKLLVHTPDHSVGCNLVVIDGLDESASLEGVEDLVKNLCQMNLPFRFLLVSRPEDYIKSAFADVREHGQLLLQLMVEESEKDVLKVIQEGFLHIRSVHLKGSGLQNTASEQDIAALVTKSQGLMVYASLAMRYICDRRGDPMKRLKDVLSGRDGLDSLYHQVIQAAKEYDYFDIVMGSLLYLRYPLNTKNLSSFLLSTEEPYKSLDIGNICGALNGCHSVLVIPEDGQPITFHHASLQDFLTNEKRSKDLLYAPTTYHVQLMICSLEEITTAFSSGTNASEYALIAWHHHACCFLSSANTDNHISGGLEHKAMDLIKNIGLEWVKSWLTQALAWAGIPYLRVEWASGNVAAKANWVDHLEQKQNF
ncbi:hypothetical protein DXG01_015407 [Tephrocybe rancida]|nr:hypothetical protein DXG01_015407 [Tephrocybe rancida]